MANSAVGNSKAAEAVDGLLGSVLTSNCVRLHELTTAIVTEAAKSLIVLYLIFILSYFVR